MTITINIGEDSLTPHLDDLAKAISSGEGLANPLIAGADELVRITKENMGDSGIDRPHEWEKLSKRYAKRLKRPHATLVLDGTLRDSVKRDDPSGNSIQVGSDVVYASAHQYGRM